MDIIWCMCHIWYVMADEAPRNIPVVFYRTRGGTELVRDWLRSLDERDRNVIGLNLTRFQFRWPVGMPVCRAMGDGLWEVWTILPSNRIARVLFCVVRDRIMVLHGFIKKTSAEERIRRLKEASVTKTKKELPRSPTRLSTLDDFLKEDGKLEEFQATAIKEVLAWQIAEAMKANNISRSALAARMKTSRSQIGRLLDPKDGNVTLTTLQRAARTVGRSLRLELV